MSMVVIAVPFMQNITYAEYRYWPGGTAYFRGDVTQRMVQRDRMWDRIDDEIHIKAGGNHAKWLVLRLAMYEYCRDQAQHILDTQGMQMKKTSAYDDYIYVSTMLYESLQPTITKVRAVLDDPNVTFATIQAHLESDDSQVHYFYSTLSARYDDALLLQHMPALQAGLHSFFLANNRYPESLDELVETRFVKKSDITGLEKSVYVAHNIPPVMQVITNAVMPYTPQESWYVLLAPMLHLPHALVWSRDRKSMEITSRTFDMKSRQELQKNPPSVVGEWGIYWHMIASWMER